MSNLKKNFIYNVAYQILILILPFVTVPYVSRVLGASGIGEYTFTYSIVYYFMICAMLGLNNYGNRTIAKVRDDKKKLSKTFKEIYIMQFFTTIIMVALYLIYILFICKRFLFISVLQSAYILSCVFDINWFYFGIEKFKITVTRNAVLKLLSLILIFLLVKDRNDIWIYTIILSGSTLLSQMILWPFLRKYITNVPIRISNVKKHFIPCLKLFLPVIAVAIYKIMDKTMIGFLSNISEVGFYENAEKIVSVPNAIIAALGTVMLPRMSNIYAKGQDKEAKKLIEKSMTAIMFLAFAMMFGLITVSKNFTIIFFGSEFVKSGTLIIYLSVTIIFLSWGNVIRTQYLIPKEMDKDYIISAFLGALVNLTLNFIFIPRYASIGACYGTIAAELIVMVYQTIAVSKYLPINKYINNTIPFIIKSIIMFVPIFMLNYIEMNVYVRLILQVVFGITIYSLLNIKYILSLVNFRRYFNYFNKLSKEK